MEGSVMAENMLSGSSVGAMELQAPLQYHQHYCQMTLAHHQLQEMVPLSVSQHVGSSHECEQSLALAELKDASKNSLNCNKAKPCMSDEDEPSFTEDGTDSYHSGGKGKKISPWQRMRWTDAMVRHLITVVFYVDEDAGSNCANGNRKKSGILQKKGKWKSVSRFMMEQGCYVSPQQCEDKFNDLNKRYKRLNDVLGRGTSCKVVENPTLLDSMDHLSEKIKEDVRKILSSKHLFYEEMCSYHNGNRLHIPTGLGSQLCQRSLLALKSRDYYGACKLMNNENGGDDQQDEKNEDIDKDEADDDDVDDEDAGVAMDCFPKRMKVNKNPEEVNNWMPSNSFGHGIPSASGNVSAEMSGILPDGAKTEWMQRRWMRTHILHLEEQKLGLQAQTIELEKERFKWQKFSSKRRRELERMKLENEKVKLENEHMVLQLKLKELEFNKVEVSMTSPNLVLERSHGREQNELGRGQCIR